MAKYKIQKLEFKFGETAIKVTQAPAARPQSCDPVDVTCLDENEEKFIPGAVVKNGVIQVIAQGLTEPLNLNSVGNIEIKVSYSDGSSETPTDKTVTIPNCILKEITPPDPAANGDRAANWTLVFQPGGEAAANGQAS
jgi:hypothetical protein